ncbi:hypothetical protein BP00DRAFT_179264 [Aspergillus indologenus CBS 114.80]|uniref:Uncharacterized protein n=1 Tax=Aspergillus indologenus CBS 114.80 TaxID=1450541 RepID=A0A2V5IB28_9EURO|nr:hypothetical protein BP00DRAFT_179264 [Aspergillus indologenus CBS 114.80]
MRFTQSPSPSPKGGGGGVEGGSLEASPGTTFTPALHPRIRPSGRELSLAKLRVVQEVRLRLGLLLFVVALALPACLPAEIARVPRTFEFVWGPEPTKMPPHQSLDRLTYCRSVFFFFFFCLSSLWSCG